jgi:hypothetical protein
MVILGTKYCSRLLTRIIVNLLLYQVPGTEERHAVCARGAKRRLLTIMDPLQLSLLATQMSVKKAGLIPNRNFEAFPIF